MVYEREHLVALTLGYCAATGISPDALSAKILSESNRKMLNRLLRGDGCNHRSAERATAWFRENWPKDAAWPPEVPPREEKAA